MSEWGRMQDTLHDEFDRQGVTGVDVNALIECIVNARDFFPGLLGSVSLTGSGLRPGADCSGHAIGECGCTCHRAECGALGLCEKPPGHDGSHSVSVERAAALSGESGEPHQSHALHVVASAWPDCVGCNPKVGESGEPKETNDG